MAFESEKFKKINEDIDRLLKHFSEKLNSFNESTDNFFVVRKDFLRSIANKEDKKSVENNNGFSRKIMFKNAPFSNEDFIIAEKKKW